jgi:large repetitive protein
VRSSLLLAVVVGLALAAPAQNQNVATSTPATYVRPLINQPVDESERVVLKGNTHPLARAQYDRGAAPVNLPMERMLLVLKRSPEQESALSQLLDAQQDKSSPQYHKWLTPDQFGKQFGASDSDLQIVTGWLQTHGFSVGSISHGRTVIEFSGTAAQVQEAFGTAIHQYVLKGQPHWANASDPQIPAALAPVVAGVRTLHNFLKKPQLVVSSERARITYTASGMPQATSTTGLHALGPGDYATIYHISSLYNSGIYGAGTTLAVIGRSDIDLSDVFGFQGLFGFSFGVNVIVNGPDPGVVPGDDIESTLDVTWSGAIARGANIDFVVSASTNTTDGIDLSTEYVIDNNLADVMTTSYGFCELAQGVTSADLTAISMLAEQGAAQGITQMVSSGDSGSAGCDDPSSTTAQFAPSVNALAATPFTVAVGGTMFNDTANPTKYWNSTPGLTTALSYIPENVWNETCTTTCQPGQPPLLAGGGGPSSFFSKPSWQSGVANIPQDGKRDIPDVSLSAALHDGYLLCYAGSCNQGGLWIIGGTSASAPSFAGIMALVNNKMNLLNNTTGSRQGQANYVLYKLAAKQNNSQCNGSSTSTPPASTCVFNDVTVGNNSVPGEAGYNTTTAKYRSAVAYDAATGLGSINVTNLVNNWNTVTFSATTTTLTVNSGNAVNLPHGSSVPLHVVVAPSSGTGATPSGDVSLLTSIPGNDQSVTFFNLDTAGTVTATTRLLPGGTYNVRAHYAGNAVYGSSNSADTSVTITREPSNTTESVSVYGSTNSTTAAYGSPIYAEADVAGQSGQGTPTGFVTFFDNNANYLGSFLLSTEAHTLIQNGIVNLPPGPHSVVANYQGDNSFNVSSSAARNFSITQGSTTSTVQATPNSAAEASSVMLNATITTTSLGNPPTGSFTFLNNGSPLGPSVFVNPIYPSTNPVQYAGGTSSFSTSSLPTGQNSITVQYSGDTNYVASMSGATAVNVLADFSLPGPLTSITVARGSKGTTVLTITGNPGYNSTINFTGASCSGLPFESSCTFSPATVTGNGNTTITVTTTAPTAGLIQPNGLEFWASGGGVMFAGIFLVGASSRGRRRWLGLVAVLVFAGLLAGVGCGGHSSSGPPPNPGTPTGTYNVAVNAVSGPLGPHSTTFSLTVQ